MDYNTQDNHINSINDWKDNKEVSLLDNHERD